MLVWSLEHWVWAGHTVEKVVAAADWHPRSTRGMAGLGSSPVTYLKAFYL